MKNHKKIMFQIDQQVILLGKFLCFLFTSLKLIYQSLFVGCYSMYKEDRLTGGHVIMLGKNCSEAAFESLREYPHGLQIGGGINLDNAMEYINAGASHVIVTSYVFNEGNIDFQRLQTLSQLIGRDRLVIDLSCRRNREINDGLFYVVTNKWTKYTSFPVT